MIIPDHFVYLCLTFMLSSCLPKFVGKLTHNPQGYESSQLQIFKQTIFRSLIMSTRRSGRLSARAANDIKSDKSIKTLHSITKKISGQGKKIETTPVVAKNRTQAKTPIKASNTIAKPKSSTKRKAPKEEEEDPAGEPVTPLKRSKSQSRVPYPSTPDPDLPLAKPRAKKVSRPANPKTTNAPLQTPGGTRILKAYPADLFGNTTSKNPVAHLTTDTDNILQNAINHLVNVDPRLKAATEKHLCTVITPESLQEKVDPFNALASSIISQQVSGAAAASIKRKFVGLFVPDVSEAPEGFFPTPTQVKVESIQRLRSAGLSERKAEYISGLAQKFADGELSAELLIEASDEELLEKLIAVRGLGRWSVEMFAFFALKRLDIFSTGDLGVQRGMAAYMGRDVSKLKAKGKGKWKYMSEQEMIDIANRFVPYRSVFMWYMWRMEDVNLDALGG